MPVLKVKDGYQNVTVLAPENADTWLSFVGLALLVSFLGMAISGVRWSELSPNPWSWYRNAVIAAAEHGSLRFWLTWLLFSASIILGIIGLFLVCFLMFGPL